MSSQISFSSVDLEKFIGPTYLLDLNYYFVDWNRAFDELVAKPMNLSRGEFASKFVEGLENREQCLERSAKIFGAGKKPTKDHEELIFPSEKYGRIQFWKVAHLIEEQQAWVVHLIIRNAEKWDSLIEETIYY